MEGGDAEWGAAIEAYLTGPAVGAGGVRAVAVGFEKSLYIPPYDTEVNGLVVAYDDGSFRELRAGGGGVWL